MGRLDGRTALVTGASRGIGEQCARALDREGARVALASRSVGDMDVIASEMTDAVVLQADLSAQDAATELAERAVSALGGVDILVNNAGISDRQGTHQDIMHINYMVPLELTASLAMQMSERANGSVIHMSSIAGTTGVAELRTYGASKAAIDALTRSQAGEFGPIGVRVNGVAPGLILTEMWEAGRKIPGLAAGLERHIALGRWGTPDEIASVVMFLASDDARYVTGQTITVDGGFQNMTAWAHYADQP